MARRHHESLKPGRLTADRIVHAARGPAFSTDSSFRLRHWNREARDLFGYRSEWAIGRPVERLLDPRDIHENPFSAAGIPLWDLIGRGEPVRPFEISLRAASGERVRTICSLVVLVDSPVEDLELVYLLQPTFRRRRADEVIDRLLDMPEWKGPTAVASLHGSSSRVLTSRQLEVLRCVADGKSSQQIADELCVSVHTVRSHQQAILERLDAHSQVEAVATAFRDHLL